MKLLSTTLTALMFALALAACGGEDPCEHLAETCALCTDATVKANCQAIANLDEHESCEASDASYDAMCGGS